LLLHPLRLHLRPHLFAAPDDLSAIGINRAELNCSSTDG
jgi:hypothetical protein